MAYSKGTAVQNASSASGTTLSPTTPPTYLAHDVAWVVVTYDNTSAITETVTDGVNTYVKVGSTVVDAGNSQCMAQFVCKDCAAGTPTVVFNLATTRPNRGIFVLPIRGLDNAATPVAGGQLQSAPGSGTNAISSGNINPSAQPGFFGGLVLNTSDFTTTFVAGTPGFTDNGGLTTWDGISLPPSRYEDVRITSTSAKAATFTASSGTGQNIALAFTMPEPASAPVVGSRIRRNTIHPGRHPDKFGKRLKTRRNTFIAIPTPITGSIAATEDNDTSSFTALNVPLTGSRRLKSSFHPGRGPYNIYRFVRTKRNTQTVAVNLSGSISANEADDIATLAALETIPATLSATESADTSAFQTVESIPATLSATEASDTSSFIAVESINGVLSATEADDTATFIGAETITGSLSAIEASDVASLIALEVISGTIAATEAADIASFSDGNSNAGSITALENSDTSAFVVLETLPGQIAATEANDLAAFVAVETTTGSINALEANDSANFSTVESIVGNLSAIESPDISTITALESLAGSINAFESPDIASFSDGNTNPGSISATEANDVSNFSVSENIKGSISALESDDVCGFSVSESLAGSISANEANDIASFASQQNINAILSAIENSDTSSFVLNESLAGSINVLEASDTAILNAVESLIGSIGAVEDNDTCAFISNIIQGSITALETNDLANFVALESFIGSISAIEDFDISSFSDYREESTTFPIGNKFDRSIKAALRLISKNGQKVVWRIISDVPNVNKPWEASLQNIENRPVYICFLPVNRNNLESLILKKDMEIPKGCVLGLMGVVSFEPNLEDVVIRNGVELSVFYIDKLNPNGQNILYTLLLKE